MASPARSVPDGASSAGAGIGGIVGPLAFIAAWLIAGTITSRSYSPIDDAISRLAAVGSDTRWLMTCGFVVFGVGVMTFARTVRRALDGPAWIALLTTGLATLGVAATPLDASTTVDSLHAAMAFTGYASLIGVPMLCARPVGRVGRRKLAIAAWVSAAVATVALVLSIAHPTTGVWQRIGLTAGDAWIVALAVTIVRGRFRRDAGSTRG